MPFCRSLHKPLSGNVLSVRLRAILFLRLTQNNTALRRIFLLLVLVRLVAELSKIPLRYIYISKIVGISPFYLFESLSVLQTVRYPQCSELSPYQLRVDPHSSWKYCHSFDIRYSFIL